VIGLERAKHDQELDDRLNKLMDSRFKEYCDKRLPLGEALGPSLKKPE
jgi:hypothetical protein